MAAEPGFTIWTITMTSSGSEAGGRSGAITVPPPKPPNREARPKGRL